MQVAIDRRLGLEQARHVVEAVRTYGVGGLSVDTLYTFRTRRSITARFGSGEARMPCVYFRVV